MFAGPLTSQSLQQAFRTLSYRRQHGILWLGLGQEERIILFQEGKIVSVASNRESTARAICHRLARAGYLSDKVVSLISKTEVPVPQLFELLVSKQYVTQEEFVRAKTAHEYDLLHSLRDVQSGKMKFTPKAVRSDPRLALSAYPGQVLLDMAEMVMADERFLQLFSNLDAAKVLIRQIGEMYEGHCEPERIVFGVLDGSSSPPSVFAKSLLSRHETVQALLSLFDQRLISVVSCEDEALVEHEPEEDTTGDLAAFADESRPEEESEEESEEEYKEVVEGEDEDENKLESFAYEDEINAELEQALAPDDPGGALRLGELDFSADQELPAAASADTGILEMDEPLEPAMEEHFPQGNAGPAERSPQSSEKAQGTRPPKEMPFEDFSGEENPVEESMPQNVIPKRVPAATRRMERPLAQPPELLQQILEAERAREPVKEQPAPTPKERPRLTGRREPPPVKDMLERRSAERLTSQRRQDEEAVSEQMKTAEATIRVDAQAEKPSTFGMRLISINLSLLEVQHVREVVLLATMVFLLSFSLSAPSLIERWFQALSDFTSGT